MLRREQDRAGAQRLFARACEIADRGVSIVAPLEAQYQAGRRRNAQIPGPICRRRGAHSICGDRAARYRQVVNRNATMPESITTGWGLIAGNGRFPFLVLEGARSQGIDMAVIALKEEASQELAS